ncbi:MAG: hypothetical protein WA652_06120, partial [Xanthobacteraceae bacterium]
MRSETPKQRDLLVGERPHLLAIDADHADQFGTLEHGHKNQRSRAGESLDGFAGHIRVYIGNVHHLFGIEEPVEQRRLFAGAARIALMFGHPGLRRVVQRDPVEHLAIIEDQIAKIGLTDSGSVLQDRLEYGLQLALRGADDSQHLGGRGLLLQRLSEIVGALAQFIEQPRVLDGNYRLIGEVVDQRYLLVGKGANFQPIDAKYAFEFVVLEQRNKEKRTGARISSERVFSVIHQHVGDLNDPFCGHELINGRTDSRFEKRALFIEFRKFRRG